MVTGLAWVAVSSPVGDLHVACSVGGLARVSFGPPPGHPASPPASAPLARAGAGAAGAGSAGTGTPGTGAAGAGSTAAASAAPPGARALAAEAARQLDGYFAGRLREFRLLVDWSWASQTQRQVLTALTGAAGYGETITYGDLARRAGLPADGGTGATALPQPGSAGGQEAAPPAQPFLPARVVGQVMGSNQCPVIIPCHRVVAGNSLGGYSGGTGVAIKRWLLTFEGALPPTLDWDPTGANLPR